MAIPQTARRALLVAILILLLYLFFAPSSISPTSISVQHDSIGKTFMDDSPLRSYPPPSSHNASPGQQSPQSSSPKTLRERLAYHFPYEIESKFPAYVWQTWKNAPGDEGFTDRLRPFEASWSEQHPGFVHEVITDDAAVHLINYLYTSVPEVIEAYQAMPLPVLKADFFRYLILLARGGIYSDIDTIALKPASDWLPAHFDRSTIGLVIGIEADPDREDWADWYARRIQFCQWTIQSKPGHPVLVDLVATITEDTLQMKKANQLKKGYDPPKSIMEFTGPGVWTDAIFSYLNNEEYFDFSTRTSKVSYSDFFGITIQKRIGDVVILPITSFSPGVGQMGANEPDDPLAFVKHEFDGTYDQFIHKHRWLTFSKALGNQKTKDRKHQI